MINKILYIKWNSYLKEDIEKSLKCMVDSLDTIEILVDGYTIKKEYVDRIKNQMNDRSYDSVFTLNYIPEISKICESKSVKYVSWIYDAPCATLYDKSALNDCNYIFSFDRNVIEEIGSKGVKKAYYMPLASSDVFLSIDSSLAEEYKYDVTFVGSTYEKMLDIYKQCMNAFPDYLKGYITAVISSQLLLDGSYILEDAITDKTEKMFKSILDFDLGEGYLKGYKSFFANYVLGAKVTQEQRITTLNLLAEYYKVDLFSGDCNMDLISKKINVHKPVEYGKELARVYRSSKINLNMTMANIQEGIPLRVFEIMGSGGFVMTNYRPGIEEHFTDGQDLVIYYDKTDLVNKIEYYLSHEEERKEIAENGRRKISSEYRVENKLKDIFLNLEDINV